MPSFLLPEVEFELKREKEARSIAWIDTRQLGEPPMRMDGAPTFVAFHMVRIV